MGKNQVTWFKREASNASNSPRVCGCLPVCMPMLWPNYWHSKVSVSMLISTPHVFMKHWHWDGHWTEMTYERPGCCSVGSCGPEGKTRTHKEPWCKAEMRCAVISRALTNLSHTSIIIGTIEWNSTIPESILMGGEEYFPNYLASLNSGTHKLEPHCG